MTTYAAFISGLAAVNIAGVAAGSRKTAPPLSVATADLPLSFPALPRATQAPVVFTGGERWAAITVDLVVLTEAAGQATLPENYAQAVAMMDALHEGIAALDIGRARLSWSIQLSQYPVGGVNYWAVIATVEGRG